MGQMLHPPVNQSRAVHIDGNVIASGTTTLFSFAAGDLLHITHLRFSSFSNNANLKAYLLFGADPFFTHHSMSGDAKNSQYPYPIIQASNLGKVDLVVSCAGTFELSYEMYVDTYTP